MEEAAFQQGVKLEELSMADMQALWDQAKAAE
jgi:uncharacterized protein YabN with tetrapyrrole methylase and pyrophosphatase domain